MNKVSIRQATIDDAGLIAAISRKTFYETFAHQNTKEDMEKFMNEQFTVEKLEAEVQEPEFSFFMVYADELPAGYLKLSTKGSSGNLEGRTAVEICRIYADSSFIGKGIGKLLMQKALEVAAQKHCEVVWLGVWEKNQLAIDFYIKWGFEKFGSHVFLLGNDPQTDWLMKKEMQP